MPVPTLAPLYADDQLLVYDKPAGLLSVPGRGPEKADCLSARAQNQYPDALVVHRLDMGTSGLLALARGPEAQRTLSVAFAQRQVHKRYVAVVAGAPSVGAADPEGWSDIHLPLIVDWPNRPRSKVDHAAGKPSHTRWRVLGQGCVEGVVATALELEPVTGRSHQLRVHLMALGHPILGDDLYAPPAVRGASERLLLHARDLDVPHPAHGGRVVLHNPAPWLNRWPWSA